CWEALLFSLSKHSIGALLLPVLPILPSQPTPTLQCLASICNTHTSIPLSTYSMQRTYLIWSPTGRFPLEAMSSPLPQSLRGLSTLAHMTAYSTHVMPGQDRFCGPTPRQLRSVHPRPSPMGSSISDQMTRSSTH